LGNPSPLFLKNNLVFDSGVFDAREGVRGDVSDDLRDGVREVFGDACFANRTSYCDNPCVCGVRVRGDFRADLWGGVREVFGVTLLTCEVCQEVCHDGLEEVRVIRGGRGEVFTPRFRSELICFGEGIATIVVSIASIASVVGNLVGSDGKDGGEAMDTFLAIAFGEGVAFRLELGFCVRAL
jgi:hypothetical protein